MKKNNLGAEVIEIAIGDSKNNKNNTNKDSVRNNLNQYVNPDDDEAAYNSRAGMRKI